MQSGITVVVARGQRSHVDHLLRATHSQILLLTRLLLNIEQFLAILDLVPSMRLSFSG